MGKRTVSAILILGILLTLTGVGFASSATTTYNSAAKDFSANTEIYAVTADAPASYPYYGAKFEPKNGVYYGRTTNPDWLSADTYGLTNGAAMTGETAFAYYYSLGDVHALEEYSYMFSSLNGGDRIFLLNFNFEQEAADCSLILQGVYDAQLRETFAYLSTMDCPLMLRIAGEVNVWGDMPEPWLFIQAFRYVVETARVYCPDMAMVYSPNYSSGYQVDMDSFYPGDEWVDWIGASLYYNRYAGNGDTERDAFYGVAAYGNPVLNMQQVVNLSRLHGKPIVITEGGSYWYRGRENLTLFASENVEKAYAYLTMVYPEIKCIIYSDTNFGFTNPLYYIFNNPEMTAAYDSGVASNRTLLHSLRDRAGYYTPLSEFTGDWSGDVTLTAYTCSDRHLTAVWYIDGQQMETVSEYPYAFTVPGGTVDTGTHYIGVSFSNGESKVYMIQNFTLQPRDLTVIAGEEASFQVRVLGAVESYLWQYSSNGVVWHNVDPEECPSARTDTLTFPAETWYSGQRYHCVVVFTDGAMAISDPAGLTVCGISAQPEGAAVPADSTVTLSLGLQGDWTDCRWQFSEDDGESWTDVSGYSTASSPRFTFPAHTYYDGLLYRCQVTFPAGMEFSEPVELTVNGILDDPADVSAPEGEDVTMRVSACGSPTGYHWQYSEDGALWHAVNLSKEPSAATDAYTFPAEGGRAGNHYRCLVTFADGTSVLSESGTLSLTRFEVQPQDTAVPAGATAVFAVKIRGTPDACRWQYSADGIVWSDLSGAFPSALTTRLSFPAGAGHSGYYYRCVAAFPDGEEISGAARLTVY
ncbi:MAG: hypothetical protein IJ206_02880 [Oscillospiraceae bacterium]|nr:hypothetical protein [Oscillospiraceae bacterium]